MIYLLSFTAVPYAKSSAALPFISGEGRSVLVPPTLQRRRIQSPVSRFEKVFSIPLPIDWLLQWNETP